MKVVRKKMGKTKTEVENRKEHRRENDFEIMVNKNYNTSTLKKESSCFSDTRIICTLYLSQTFPLILFLSIPIIIFYLFDFILCAG